MRCRRRLKLYTLTLSSQARKGYSNAQPGNLMAQRRRQMQPARDNVKTSTRKYNWPRTERSGRPREEAPGRGMGSRMQRCCGEGPSLLNAALTTSTHCNQSGQKKEYQQLDATCCRKVMWRSSPARGHVQKTMNKATKIIQCHMAGVDTGHSAKETNRLKKPVVKAKDCKGKLTADKLEDQFMIQTS